MLVNVSDGLIVNYLKESNAIESITNIDYAKAENRKNDQGHWGAFIKSQMMATQHEPLTIKKICEWQKMVATEQRSYQHEIEDVAIGRIRNPQTLQKNVRIGQHIPPTYNEVPTLLGALIEKVNQSLKEWRNGTDVEFCKLIGESFQEFECIHPFADGNGRVGRLLANYIATYCRRPIIVFKSEMVECNRYYAAHQSKAAMCAFFANKIKESVIGYGGYRLEHSTPTSSSTVAYEDPIRNMEEVTHWHGLDQAASDWRDLG